MCSFGSCQMRFEFLSQFRKVRNVFECFVTQVQMCLPKNQMCLAYEDKRDYLAPIGGGRGIVMPMSVCLCVCLFVCLFVCVFVCLFVCLFVRVFAKFQSVISQPFLNRSL